MKWNPSNKKIAAGTLFFVLYLSLALTGIANADAKTDLQQKIDQRNNDIAALQVEIANYQKQLGDLGSQASSLSATIKTLDLTQKKLAADESLTQNKIAAKNLEIDQFGTQIGDKENAITSDHRVIITSLTQIDQTDNRSIFDLIFGAKSVSNVLDALDQVGIVQNNIVSRINDLRNAKADLEANKTASEQAKADLVTLNNQLNDQRKVVLGTQTEKNQLLSETKQSESQYQKMLAAKQAQQAAFNDEILQYEAQLKTIVNAGALPHTGSGVLSWPLDKIRITQYFGNTPFATANPQIYNGKGHTGVDFAATIGTPVKAALSGTVIGVANTDIVPGCFSYGKWIMLKHNNGLSTLYAHLSVQSVSIGQSVATGDIIGYSGNTGYTTGPHLHFGVYATEGVEIKDFSTSVNCKGAIVPVASFNAYLNPLSYL